MLKETIGILGATGFVGKNLLERLTQDKIRVVGGSRETGVDARDLKALIGWVSKNDISCIVNLAAECGGIGLNLRKPADLWGSTALISAAVLEAARICKTKLIMVGTVCSYAKNCPIPFKEEYLMTYGEPESSNAAYGMAKLSGLFGAKAYNLQYGLNVVNLIPVNMYGPHDHFDLENSHVIPALIRKMIDARDNNKSVTIWGSGSPTREFLYAGDFAEAVLLALNKDVGPTFMNIGSGSEISISDLAKLIADIIGFDGSIVWDETKPDGQPRRCLDVSKAKELIGFEAKTTLKDGLEKTVQWYGER